MQRVQDCPAVPGFRHRKGIKSHRVYRETYICAQTQCLMALQELASKQKRNMIVLTGVRPDPPHDKPQTPILKPYPKPLS